MKILVINLLRLGDMLMTTPVLNGLAARRRDAQIDVLSFKPVSALHPMLPMVRRWWTLDRDELQAGMGRGDLPLLSSFSVLQEQLNAINAEKYDLIINLSQTHFSAWVAGYLKSADRLGLTYDLKGQPHFYSPWFRYLDEHTDESVTDVFHHTDIFAHACGLGEVARDWSLLETEKGRQEVSMLDLTPNETVVLQLFTSDEKKNWPIASWIELVRSLKFARPEVQVVALAAPNEKAKLTEFIEAVKLDVIPAVLSMEGAFALLNRADLLISGDTSIKHLANGANAKVLELSIGWSDWRRTGIFKADSMILRAGSDQVLPVEPVFMAAHGMLDDDWTDLSSAAGRTRRSAVQFLRTHELEAGFWFGQSLSEQNPTEVVSALVERCAWKITLNRERQGAFSQFGSESMVLGRELQNLISTQHTQPVLAHLDFLEQQEFDRGRAMTSELSNLKRSGKEILNEPGQLPDIASFRKKQIELEFTFQHSEHKTKLIRTLKSNWMECL